MYMRIVLFRFAAVALVGLGAAVSTVFYQPAARPAVAAAVPGISPAALPIVTLPVVSVRANAADSSKARRQAPVQPAAQPVAGGLGQSLVGRTCRRILRADPAPGHALLLVRQSYCRASAGIDSWALPGTTTAQFIASYADRVVAMILDEVLKQGDALPLRCPPGRGGFSTQSDYRVQGISGMGRRSTGGKTTGIGYVRC